jgi:methionyl-tRNA formyltransferase
MPRVLRLVFMGTPAFAATILDGVIAAGIRPVLVVTQPARPAGRGRKEQPSAVAERAGALGLPCIAVENVNAPDVMERLAAAAPDIILVAAFGQILKQPLLDLPKLHCLNVHGSLLPKYRGAAPVQRALWNGDEVTGITIQKMARRLDTGDVLLQRSVAIEPDDNAETLLARLAKVGAELAVESIYRIVSGRYEFVPQDPAQATYAAKLDKSDAPLDFQLPAQMLHNRVRALVPWPVAETRLGAQRLKIYATRVEPGPFPQSPGTLVTDGRRELTIVCGDARGLGLIEVQPENGKRMPVRDFLGGFRGQLPVESVG